MMRWMPSERWEADGSRRLSECQEWGQGLGIRRDLLEKESPESVLEELGFSQARRGGENISDRASVCIRHAHVGRMVCRIRWGQSVRAEGVFVRV